MLVTLALVVFFASIIVFFSDEFIRFFKKIFAIKGTKLIIPLFLASWLIYNYDFWVLWFVYDYREMMQAMLGFLIHLMPFDAELSKPLSTILLLTVISVLPVFLIDLLVRRKSYHGYRYPNVTSIILFIVSSILLLAL